MRFGAAASDDVFAVVLFNDWNHTLLVFLETDKVEHLKINNHVHRPLQKINQEARRPEEKNRTQLRGLHRFSQRSRDEQ
jgi:hypothetical protein